MAGCGIGVLAEDHHLYRCGLKVFKCCEYLGSGRQNLTRLGS
jgi:hypothetical protein